MTGLVVLGAFSSVIPLTSKAQIMEKTVNALSSKPCIDIGEVIYGKTALIAEGGGQRGIFTAGVLDAWLENDFDPFELFIGTSAGSQNLTSYLSRIH